MFPGELLSATDIDPNDPGQVIGRTEVKRREVYMKKLEVLVTESRPVLVQLVTQSLHNNPQARPSSEELLGILRLVKIESEKVYGGNVWRRLNISNVLLGKEMKMKDKQIEELQVMCDIYSMCIVKYRMSTIFSHFSIQVRKLTEHNDIWVVLLKEFNNYEFNPFKPTSTEKKLFSFYQYP